MIGHSDIARLAEYERRAAQQAEAKAWPEGVIARYLTVGGATVDITYSTKSGLLTNACTGCSIAEHTNTNGAVTDSPEEEQARVEECLPIARRWAQEHAETCRALPRPAVT
ncbi:hypothetical protein ACWERY_16135 [Streptomyces sp. NPDC004082]|uniref:hypothetical protein n=1 Tax=unclassified Streptomyces TaxID=2593676 RepID=UPI0033AF5922